MFGINMDDHSMPNPKKRLTIVSLNIVRWFFRSKLIFLWIFVFIIMFFYLNSMPLLSNNDISEIKPHSQQNKISDSDLNDIRNRIEALENSLDNLNNNANNLKNIFKTQNLIVNSELKKLNEKKLHQEVKSPSNFNHEKIAVLVMACNRPQSVENHLKQLFEKRSQSNDNIQRFPIIVSQDCNHQETSDSIQKFSNNLYAFLKQPDQTDITQSKTGRIPSHMKGYFKISRHYKWALDQVFVKYNFSSVIITEDDLNIAVDFFDYFKSMFTVLEKDETLYCASAWNDNGKKELIDISKPGLVHRSDFFPGLGWLMMKDLWINELRNKWPQAFWDDWLRETEQRKGRSCIRPEISRTDMAIQYAKNGVSMGQFFDNYLRLIVINKEAFDWSKVDTSFLIKETYDKKYLSEVYDNSLEVSFVDYLQNIEKYNADNRSILIIYNNKDEFLKAARYFGMMTDFKSGVPRTGYLGIVRIFFKSKVIYLAPKEKKSWITYDPNYK